MVETIVVLRDAQSEIPTDLMRHVVPEPQLGAADLALQALGFRQDLLGGIVFAVGPEGQAEHQHRGQHKATLFIANLP